MSSFEVTGGKRLKGEITPQGAKNEALQVLSAVLLTASPVTISNIPDILDVNLLIELLGDIGVKISRTDRHTCTFQADTIDADFLASDTFRKKGSKLRGSIMLAGQALLIAALSAEGKSVIQNIEQIDRGYQYIDERLKNLGAEIKRIA